MGLWEQVNQFHFIRPGYLLLLLPSLLIYCLAKKYRRDSSPWGDYIPAKFLQYFQLPGTGRHWLAPSGYSLMVSVVWLLAIAGPSWQPQVSPLNQAQQAIVLVLKLDQSMVSGAVQSQALTRAKLKILDFVRLNRSAEIGLLVYAGSAHEVLPPSKDHNVLLEYLNDLNPNLMPQPGAKPGLALTLARQVLTRNSAMAVGSKRVNGAVLFFSDGAATEFEMATADGEQLKPTAEIGRRLVLLINTPELADSQFFKSHGFNIIYSSDDRQDVEAASSLLKQAWRQSRVGDSHWQDQGYALVWLLLLLMLPWFRKGMVLSWR